MVWGPGCSSGSHFLPQFRIQGARVGPPLSHSPPRNPASVKSQAPRPFPAPITPRGSRHLHHARPRIHPHSCGHSAFLSLREGVRWGQASQGMLGARPLRCLSAQGGLPRPQPDTRTLGAGEVNEVPGEAGSHSSRNKVWEENTHWNTVESLKTALSAAGQEDFVPRR